MRTLVRWCLPSTRMRATATFVDGRQCLTKRPEHKSSDTPDLDHRRRSGGSVVRRDIQQPLCRTRLLGLALKPSVLLPGHRRHALYWSPTARRNPNALRRPLPGPRGPPGPSLLGSGGIRCPLQPSCHRFNQTEAGDLERAFVKRFLNSNRPPLPRQTKTAERLRHNLTSFFDFATLLLERAQDAPWLAAETDRILDAWRSTYLSEGVRSGQLEADIQGAADELEESLAKWAGADSQAATAKAALDQRDKNSIVFSKFAFR